jgi:hypothetical protein
MRVLLQVGDQFLRIYSEHLPPVGAKFPIHKNVSVGSNLLLEVLSHEWQLEQPDDEKSPPAFSVTIKTRIADDKKAKALVAKDDWKSRKF